MITEYLGPITEDEIDKAHPILERAARLIQQGSLVAIPSETIYGLSASILSESAVRQLFEVKGRSESHSLPVMVSSLDQLKFVARDVPPMFHILANSFLPGPLTIILKKSSLLSSKITGNKDSVAIRYSSSPIARRIAEMTGCPLVLPSANLTGNPSPITAKHVLEDFNGKIHGIVDGGETEHGLESTVISLEDPDQPVLYRFGIVSQMEIEKVLGKQLRIHPDAVMTKKAVNLNHLPAIRLFSSWEEIKIYLQLSNDSKRLVMSSDEKSPLNSVSDFFKLTAKNLYEGLRLALRNGYAEVLVLCNPLLKNDENLHRRLKQIANT